jgi:hypothetical protein
LSSYLPYFAHVGAIALVFLLAGASGILMVVVPYLLKRQTSEHYPPAA